MTLPTILVFGAAALLTLLIIPDRWRGWVVLLASLAALYALQPATPVRYLDYWLPTASLALCVLGWAVTRTRPVVTALKAPPVPAVLSSAGTPAGAAAASAALPPAASRTSLAAGLLILSVVLLVALTRYIEPLCCLTPSRPPALPQVLVAIVLVGVLALSAVRLTPVPKWVVAAGLAAVVLLFIVLKTDPLAQAASAALRSLAGQSTALAKGTDIRWLGFSYMAFRVLHTLRDRQTGRLPALNLFQYVNYVIFFPSLTAGPIDRVERFTKDFERPQADRAAALALGGKRVALGLFKKFVLADTLALAALGPLNAAQVDSGPWLWLLLYGYALRIYFDFSGYTDIAIGLGIWLGVKLPENFDRPYLKPNLTAFWNSWHITLAQWFRAYFFNPLARALRTGKNPWPPFAIILLGQFGTMVLIGLWHGVTVNFFIWGAWHGLGLFFHNRWQDVVRSHPAPERWQPVMTVISTFLTFNYVALGWVWFALPDASLSLSVLAKLFSW